MPRFTDDLEQIVIPGNHYGYSGTKLNKLEATEYTLCQLVVDVSGSVGPFKTEMEDCIKEVIQSCQLSPRADNLMVRLVTFDDRLTEVHGFKPLSQCNLADYDNSLQIGGMTALYDAVDNAVKAGTDYASKLTGADFSVNGLTVIITDGADNISKVSKPTVKKAIEACVVSEKMESMVSILIGVGTVDQGVVQYLNDFKQDVGITQFVNAGDAKKSTLAKLAQFISKSISSQSQSLGSGNASQSLTF